MTKAICDCEPTVYDDGSIGHEQDCEVYPWCPHEVCAYSCLMPCGCPCPPCRACQRLRENWEMVREEAAKPKPLPPLCGECDNRWVETESGALARCPRCNPQAVAS